MWQRRPGRRATTSSGRRTKSMISEARSTISDFSRLAVWAPSSAGSALYGLWYTKGRDPQVGPVAAFLAHPPGDLPPGAVGVLLDEVADQRDVVATLVDLGNRGVIKLEESKSDGILGIGSSSDYDITPGSGARKHPPIREDPAGCALRIRARTGQKGQDERGWWHDSREAPKRSRISCTTKWSSANTSTPNRTRYASATSRWGSGQ